MAVRGLDAHERWTGECVCCNGGVFHVVSIFAVLKVLFSKIYFPDRYALARTKRQIMTPSRLSFFPAPAPPQLRILESPSSDIRNGYLGCLKESTLLPADRAPLSYRSLSQFAQRHFGDGWANIWWREFENHRGSGVFVSWIFFGSVRECIYNSIYMLHVLVNPTTFSIQSRDGTDWLFATRIAHGTQPLAQEPTRQLIPKIKHGPFKAHSFQKPLIVTGPMRNKRLTWAVSGPVKRPVNGSIACLSAAHDVCYTKNKFCRTSKMFSSIKKNFFILFQTLSCSSG